MKYCTECGQQLEDDARFCSRCGKRQPAPRGTEPAPFSPAGMGGAPGNPSGTPVSGDKSGDAAEPANARPADSPGAAPAPGWGAVSGGSASFGQNGPSETPSDGAVPAAGWGAVPGGSASFGQNGPSETPGDGAAGVPPRWGTPPPLGRPLPAVVPPALRARPKKEHSTLFFVWSMILIFICNPIGTPLSIVSAVLAAAAHADQDADRRDGRLQICKTICIAVSCLDVVCLIAMAAAAVAYLLRRGGAVGPYVF